MTPAELREALAERDHLIPLTEKESVALLREGVFLDCSFGGGGMALNWKKGTPMPEAVLRLGFMRGVLNENCGGAGI